MSFKQVNHVGFDVSQTGANKAGCGFFAHAIVKEMLEISPGIRYSLYPSFGDFYFDPLIPIKNPYQKGEYGPRHLTREMATSFWRRPDLEEALKHPEIIHSNNFWCPKKLDNSRLIYTLHDMCFLVDPNWSTETNRMGCFKGVFQASTEADWIVAMSEASKAHYLEVFPHFPEDRIRVIYQCSRFTDSNLLGTRPKAMKEVIENEFWLSVGTIEPRKNQRRLATAYARYLELGGAPMPLVFAGGAGWLMDDFQKHIRELGIEAQTIFTGYVSDEELIWLYRACYANMYPSLFEGFGLPVLEGMQFGAPTLTSNTTSIPEVAGQAALLLPPEDTESWAQAMFALSKNPTERQLLSEAGVIQAKKFNLKQSAESLLELYNDALMSPKRKEIVKDRARNNFLFLHQI